MVTSAEGAQSGNCPIVVVRTYTIEDVCGNSTNITQAFNINDITEPAITGALPDTDVEGCSSADLPAPETTVAALEALGLSISDNCTPDANMVVTSSEGVPAGNCPQRIVRTYTITDACGNRVNASQTFNVGDSTPPDITCKITTTQTVTINATTVYVHSGDGWDYDSASDGCGSVTVSAMLSGATNSGPHTTLDGVTFYQGSTTVTWTATDICGNRSTCSFGVEVSGTADIALTKTGPAVITAGQTISWTIAVINHGPAASQQVTVTDNVPVQILNPVYTLDGTPQGNWTGTLVFSDIAFGGSHSVVISGVVNCSSAGSFTNTAVASLGILNDPDLTNNSASVTTTIQNVLAITGIITNTACPGESNGSINITVTGGTQPYSYSWTGPGGFTGSNEDINGLEAGNYEVTVTDDNGCEASESFVVDSDPDTEPPTFTLPTLGNGYCVEGFEAAVYNPGGTYYVDDLTPVRRDYYILTNGNTLLDLINISDNCTGTITIAWTIDFGINSTIDLSGNGQISLSTPINLPLGDNLITWTVSDASGNPTVETLIFKVIPRPDIID